jgi:hypothetical protein
MLIHFLLMLCSISMMGYTAKDNRVSARDDEEAPGLKCNNPPVILPPLHSTFLISVTSTSFSIPDMEAVGR